jgi:4-hydroxyphenylpyruvate dioxygenase-like putative hemolysin
MSTELRVTEAHLRELAAKQGDAAVVIRSATDAADGVAGAVDTTHGPISSATAAAVAAAETARGQAGAQAAAESRHMQDRLEASAASYADVDQAVGGALNAQLRPVWK